MNGIHLFHSQAILGQLGKDHLQLT